MSFIHFDSTSAIGLSTPPLPVGLSTTVTSGGPVQVSAYTTPGFFPSFIPGYATVEATGYDGGLDFYSYAPGFGAIGADTFLDGGGNIRTLSSCYYVIGNFVGNSSVILTYNQSSVPDTNASLISLTVNGVTYNRASRTGHGTFSGLTYWFWNVGAFGFNPFSPPGGSISLVITV